MTVRSALIGPTPGVIIGDIFSIQAIFLSFIPLFGVLSLFTFMDSKKNRIDSENIAAMV